MDEEMRALVERCSRFSGWNLTWRRRKGTIELFDPADWGKSAVVVCARGLVLYEAYGRLRHWGVTAQEQEMLLRALQPAGL